jgi:hypothetical protein
MTAPPQTNPVTKLLDDNGIKHLAIVDDAYGPLLREDFATVLDHFFAEVEADPDAYEELCRICNSTPTKATDITAEMLGTLWSRQGEFKKLAVIYTRHLKPTAQEKLAPLDALFVSLTKELQREVTRHADLQNFTNTQARIIFLDYYMGRSGDANAVERSKQIVAGIKQKYDKMALPLLVLMSASNTITAKMISEFRESTGWLGGMFYFVKKGDFLSKEMLLLQIATWSISMPIRGVIQRFVESLQASAKKAAEEFQRRLSALGIEDYANIQWLNLQSEGHPLGDYLLWLYKSLFSYLLHQDDAVLKEQEQLDGINVKQFTPSQFPPSIDLAELYRSALTEPGVDDAGPHRRSLTIAAAAGGTAQTQPAGATGTTGSLPEDFYLQLGDMFFKADSPEVYIVLSAACDLNYAPGETRTFPSERFVLFERGELQPIAEFPKEAAMRTELFSHDGKAYRILWDHRGAIWKEYGQARAWLTTNGFVRRTRLSLPYSLELQRSFANYITRIGLPVRPPIFSRGTVEILCEDENGSWKRLVSVIDGAQLIRRAMTENKPDEELFVLTVDCISHVIASIQTVSDSLNAKKTPITEELSKPAPSDLKQAKQQKEILEGKLKGIQGKLDKLAQQSQALNQWLPMIQSPQPLPKPGDKQEIDSKLLWVYREFAYDGKFPNGPPLVLHIRGEDWAPPQMPAKAEPVPAVSQEGSAGEPK